jgi:hypothetical protein
MRCWTESITNAGIWLPTHHEDRGGSVSGEDKETSSAPPAWAKEIYGRAQTLVNVVLPDTFPHYNPPEPPPIPNLYAELQDDGKRIDLWWDNRSEFAYDVKTGAAASSDGRIPLALSIFQSGQRSALHRLEWLPSRVSALRLSTHPMPQSTLHGHRLRHDFQGYSLWGRSGSGSQEDWVLIERWDKEDTYSGP